ncbi:MAG: prepilin peptidase [Terracidiphilus sp.]
MMDADCSNNAAARAGSVVVCGVGSFALELSGGRSIQVQFSLPTLTRPASWTRAAAATSASYEVNTVYSISSMARVLATIFAGLLGLAFGSFLNVCLSRWPEGESIVSPRSHCRSCGRTLAWWENVPVVSWLALRGRCRSCGVSISWRYPLVELTVGVLWAAVTWRSLSSPNDFAPADFLWAVAVDGISQMIFLWLLVALAVLDFESLWLPNKITIPGTLLGLALTLIYVAMNSKSVFAFYGALEQRSRFIWDIVGHRLLAILAAAGLIVLIRGSTF